MNTISNDTNIDLKSSLNEVEESILADGFDLVKFKRDDLVGILIRVRNHYETEDNTLRSRALLNKVRLDVVSASINHTSEDNLDELKTKILNDLDQAIQLYQEKLVGPLYEHYADAESIAHMPKFNHLREAFELLTSLYLTYTDINIALKASDKKQLDVEEFNDPNRFSETFYKYSFDGLHVNHQPQIDILFFAKLKELIETI